MPGRRSSKALKDFQTAESEDAPVTTSSATGIKALIGVFGDTNADLFISARALSIPELLSIVFSFSAEPELAISARVCKTWSDPALDELWVDLDTVFPLLELVLDLEPLRDEETDRAFLEEVSRALTGANWPRFHFYAQRVRSLRLGDLDYYYKDHAPLELRFDVIGIISLHHPYGPSFLPHIRKLDWRTFYSPLQVVPFLSRELIHLDIKLSQPSEARITEIFCALRNRTPKLKTFRLEIPYRNTFSEAALVSWLEKMETLEEIELPPYYLMPRILTVMKTFPRLRIIDQTPNPWYIPKDAGILEPLPENSFPSLVQLTLPATPAATQRFLFNSSTNFTSLTSLKLHTPDDIETNQLLSFTQQIASRFPMMATIELLLCGSTTFRGQVVTALPIKILERLYPCKHLNSLRIEHPLPINFNSTDVENMGGAWPHLTDLSLCPAPDSSLLIPENMGANLSILQAFASHMPNLNTLGLYFNGRDEISFAGPLHPRYQFTRLHTLFVGFSPVPKTKIPDFSFYLASLCSQAVDVCYRYRYLGRENDMRHEAAWRDVQDMIHFAVRVKLMTHS